MILSFLQAKKFVGNKGRCEGGAGVKHSITAPTVVMGQATKEPLSSAFDLLSKLGIPSGLGMSSMRGPAMDDDNKSEYKTKYPSSLPARLSFHNLS